MGEYSVTRPMEILLVEDSLVDARFTSTALGNGQFKHRLTILRDGLSAMEFLLREGRFRRAPRPDLILLDLRLPKVDGLVVLTAIKDDSMLQTIPVVITTSSMDQVDLLECQFLGVDGYITKPIDTEKFLHIIRQLDGCWEKDMALPTVA